MLNTTTVLLPNSTLTLTTTSTLTTTTTTKSTDYVDQTFDYIKSTETSSSKIKAFIFSF